MAFERPTLAQLIRRAKSDISTRLTGANANLRGSPEEVLAIVLAGLTHGLHGHLKWLSKQVLADLAEEEFLVRMADIYGIERIAAAKASGPITITGTNGTVCPAGTQWVRDDGATFTSSADVTISAGEATPTVTADVAGVAGDTVAGVSLQIVSPVGGINSTATVSGGGIADGSDIETIDALRARLLLRLQNPPKGGGPGDYVAWALEVAGTTRAWEYPNMNGLGTVGVTFVRDNDVSLIPDGTAVATMQTYIDGKAPVTADVTVFAPVADTLNFTIAVTPNTTAVKDAVQAELEALMKRECEPGGTLYLSHIREAIGVATGITNYTLTSPAADVVAAAGHLSVFGAITWA